MPELPEVETVARGMAQMLNGCKIASVETRRPDLRIPFPADLAAAMENQTIEHIGRRAKYVLMRLGNGQLFILHLGMSGQVLLLPENKAYEIRKHDHLIITTNDNRRMIYNDARRFGMVYLCAENEMGSHPAFATIGPEPLGNAFSGAVLKAALAHKTTPIKVALLDQRIVAGIGNIYASEALYYAGIAPHRPAKSLSDDECAKLVAAIRDVLTAAIKAGGTTLRDHRQADGSLGYFQHRFAVYDRAGQTCPDCVCDATLTAGIEKFTQGSRSTFWCPRKQK